MKYAHLLNAFYGEPWHLRGEYWHNFHQLLQSALAGQEVQPDARLFNKVPSHYSTALPGRPIVGPVNSAGEPLIPQMQVAGPLAIIPVYGVLGKRLNQLDFYFGGCDYNHVSEFVRAAREDSSIEVVMLDFNSPGGRTAGCMECANDIAALTEAKPTVAFTEDQCCSAAYWLASQCREFWATSTAIVGSIGTIFCGVDNSAQWAQEGRKLELFASSPLKAAGADGKPWTDEDRDYYRERVAQADHRIKTGVKSGRAQLNEAAMDGRWFFAENSLSLGVVDAIVRDLDEAIAALL
jgi:ClpP class serine protease